MLHRLNKFMGCICSKGVLSNEGNVKDRETKLSKSSKRFVSSFKRDEVVVEPDGTVNEATARLISSPLGAEAENENGGKGSGADDDKASKALQRRAPSEVGVGRAAGPIQQPLPRVGSVPHGERGAQIVAGWPSWLSSVAGEAINGWIPRRADSFEKLEKIGQGTYSSVYRARDLKTNKIVALKKVRFANMDPESVRFMAREIIILRRLDHPNVMKLEGLITSRVSGSLYLVFEYMEHDLAGLVATPGVKFSEAQIKCYMQQLLCALEHCHSHGVMHRDVKGSNLLMDNHGNLKIADFGLATLYQPHQKQPLTSRVVTLWYRPPELLLGSTDYGPSVDLWSSGCILAEMFTGKPIMSGRTEVEQLHKIFKLCGSPSETYWKKSKLPHATIFKPQQPYKRVLRESFKDIPESAMALLEILLAVEPDNRGSASSALHSEFFTTMPLPLDLSSLPKYPPSKELDAKLRDEEARRRKATAKACGNEPTKRNIKESKAVPAPDANAELPESIQKRRGQVQPNTISMSEKFTTEEEVGAGFPIEPPKGVASKASSQYSQSIRPSHLDSAPVPHTKVESKPHRSYVDKATAQLSRFSNSVAVRGSSRFDGHRETVGRYDRLDGGESSGKPEWANHQLDQPDSLYKKGREVPRKDFNAGGKNRIHYSGPLMGPGGNLEEMLKEHEKQIQHAVRKAKTRQDHIESRPTESLLVCGRNGR